MKVNLKMLSESLGLSQTTVSRALNGYSDVSEATRLRVVEAAQKLGYQPNPQARQLATGRANAIGIVYPFGASDIGDIRFGEVVSGIAMARYGANALEVIGNLKAKLAEISAGLPQGVTIESVYDRSDLILRAVETLKTTLIEESLIVALVCVIFLLHVRSALVAILMLPVGVLIAFITMRLLGMNSNLMSLGGIAIAIGAMIDATIVMIENAHKHLERLKEGESRAEAMIVACKEVGPALFFSLLIITVSFLPVFTLEAQEGRLFAPLAYTKTFAMAGAALLSVTLVPVLMLLFIRGRIVPEAKNPVNRFLIWIYRPVIAWVMRWKKTTILAALVILAVSVYPASRLGSEFMPTLNEGTLLYMPSSLPGMSITKAAELLQTQDRIIRSFPEVASVFGKAGRASTATDPAPSEMFETVINLKPTEQWRSGVTVDSLTAEMDKALQFPGVSNAWTMPIQARIDMLSTGIRTPIGIKVFGRDLGGMEKLARQIEAVVKSVPGTTSAYAERITGGYYLNIEPDREQLARYGLAVGDLQEVIGTALGGEVVTTTVEGRERFGVQVRYPRELRSNPQQIAREVLVPTMDGAMIPLGQVAQMKIARGTPGIRTENALLSAYIFVDIRDRDIGSYVAEARKAVSEQVKFPPGYYITWSGQFEYMERAIDKMKIVIPLTLLLIFVLLYLNFRRLTETLIVMLSVPFALVGGIWLMWVLDYNLSVAVAVGFIALAGVAAVPVRLHEGGGRREPGRRHRRRTADRRGGGSGCAPAHRVLLRPDGADLVGPHRRVRHRRPAGDGSGVGGASGAPPYGHAAMTMSRGSWQAWGAVVALVVAIAENCGAIKNVGLRFGG